MQKIITIVLLALFFTLDVSGSETRVFSMGRVGYFIRDNSNITTFPGTLMRYGNEVVTELRWKDTESSYSAEARLPVNTNFMVGINFNRPIGMFVPNMSTFVELDETSDLYLGTRFIGHDVALRLSLGRDAFSQDSSAGNPPDTWNSPVAFPAICMIWRAAWNFPLLKVSRELPATNGAVWA